MFKGSDLFDSEFESVNSDEESEVYTVVPRHIEFKMQITSDERTKKLLYTLKKGIELPCLKSLGGT